MMMKKTNNNNKSKTDSPVYPPLAVGDTVRAVCMGTVLRTYRVVAVGGQWAYLAVANDLLGAVVRVVGRTPSPRNDAVTRDRDGYESDPQTTQYFPVRAEGEDSVYGGTPTPAAVAIHPHRTLRRLKRELCLTRRARMRLADALTEVHGEVHRDVVVSTLRDLAVTADALQDEIDTLTRTYGVL